MVLGRAYSSAAIAKQVEDVVIVGGGLVGATLAAAVGECGAVPSFFPFLSIFSFHFSPTHRVCARIHLRFHFPEHAQTAVGLQKLTSIWCLLKYLPHCILS